jgi:hypothetical protein
MKFWVIPVAFKTKRKNLDFRGIIQEITYDIKGTATITLNGNTYVLPMGRSFTDEMNVGDSIVKLKGSMSYKLIKRKTGEVVYGKDY